MVYLNMYYYIEVAHHVIYNSRYVMLCLGKRIRSNSHTHPWSEDEDEDEIEEQYEEDSLSQSAPAVIELNKGTSSSGHKRTSAYDIDDIVIPYQLAAATRVEKLQYKEIDTPR